MGPPKSQSGGRSELPGRQQSQGPGIVAQFALWSLLIHSYSTNAIGNIVPSPRVEVGFYQKDPYVGDKAVLSCIRKVTNQPHVAYWTKDGDMLQTDDSIYYASLYSRSILVISPLAKKDAGKYQCVTEPLKNGTQLLSSAAVVNVKDLVSVVWREGNSTSARERANATFHCETTNSDVKLKVLRNGRNVLAKHGRILQLIRTRSLDLVLLDVQVSDAGSYTCSGSDGIRRANSTILLEVYSPPTISNINLTDTLIPMTVSPSLTSTLRTGGEVDTGSRPIEVSVVPISNASRETHNYTSHQSRKVLIAGASVAPTTVLVAAGVIVGWYVLRRRNRMSYVISGTRTGGVDRPVTQEEVLRGVSIVAPVWEFVARYLQSEHLKEHHIEVIRRNSPNDVEEQAKSMLQMWRSKEMRNATVRCLCKAMDQADRRSDADDLFGESVVALCFQSESYV